MLLALCLLLQDPTLTISPPQGAIGQPLEVVLELDHPRGAGLARGGPEWELDGSWVVLEGPEVIAIASGLHTRVVWSVMSLESGERALPGLDLVLADGAALTVNSVAVDIGADLGEEEDAPRPMPVLQGVVERAGPVRLEHLGWGIVALVLAVVGGLWLRKRRGLVPAAHVQGEWARFMALRDLATQSEKGSANQSGGVQDVCAELASLLRSAAQHRVAVLRPGQADGEWLARMRAASAAMIFAFPDHACRSLLWQMPCGPGAYILLIKSLP